MKMTAPDLLALDIADEIVPEVTGGAHVDQARQAEILGEVLERQLLELSRESADALVASRYLKFRRMGDRPRRTSSPSRSLQSRPTWPHSTIDP
jgi:acetyl-CoA carboxylase carboxyl transferase subunit alpha